MAKRLRDLSDQDLWQWAFNKAKSMGADPGQVGRYAHGILAQRAAAANKPQEPPSTGEQLALGMTAAGGGALATGLGMAGGKGIYDWIAGKGGEEAGKELVGSGVEQVASPELLGAERVSGLAEGAGAMGGAPFYVPAAVGLQTLLSGKSALDMLQGNEKKLTDLRFDDLTGDPAGTAGRLGLALATGGLSELANFGLSHKGTKDYQAERWGALEDSPLAQAMYLMGHSEGDDGIWDTGKYAGQKWSWDKALDLAKEDPGHFIGALGNAEAFGDKWITTPEEQQRAVVAKLIADNQYTSDKGDILIRDKDYAKQIYDEITGATNAGN